MYHDTEYLLASAYKMRHWPKEQFEESLVALFQEYKGGAIRLHNMTWRVVRTYRPGIIEVAVSGDVEELD